MKQLTIDDIEGTWEHIHYGYIYLHIDNSKKGYFIPGLDENEDIYSISSISFDGAFAILTLVSIEVNNEQEKAECTLFGNDLLAFKAIEDGEKEEVLLFMRESKVNELRRRAEEFVKK